MSNQKLSIKFLNKNNLCHRFNRNNLNKSSCKIKLKENNKNRNRSIQWFNRNNKKNMILMKNLDKLTKSKETSNQKFKLPKLNKRNSNKKLKKNN